MMMLMVMVMMMTTMTTTTMVVMIARTDMKLYMFLIAMRTGERDGSDESMSSKESY